MQARDWPELVPVFEEYAAMLSANYNEGEWHATDWETRARAVAFYRLSGIKRLHENDAQVKHSKRQAKKK